jgi:hypothetical protein
VISAEIQHIDTIVRTSLVLAAAEAEDAVHQPVERGGFGAAAAWSTG